MGNLEKLGNQDIVQHLTRHTDVSTIQAFIELISRAFSEYEIIYVAAYSPLISDQDKLYLIATTDEVVAPRVAGNTTKKEFTLYSTQDRNCLIALKTRKEVPNFKVFQSLIAQGYELVISRKRQHIRRRIIEQAARSKDINSFAYRLLGVLRETAIFCEEVSVFIYDKQERLQLASTTSELKKFDKKDIFYLLEEDNKLVDSFKHDRPIVENADSGFQILEYDNNFDLSSLRTRAYWPIGLMPIQYTNEPNQFQAPPLGVICITNIMRRGFSRTWPTQFTEYDKDIIGYISELTFGLFHPYYHAQDQISDVSRLTHGLGASIDASIKFASAIKESIFADEIDDDPICQLRFSLTNQKEMSAALNDAYNWLRELEYFLGDLHFQFSNTQQSSFQREVIDNLHGSVLMPAARLAPAIAAVHSKKAPNISNFKESGSLLLPKVLSNGDALISVFRNLFENSIKYTAKDRPAQIEVSFDGDSKFVYIDVSDMGIGIKEKDRKNLFMEGFRSVEARQISNRGRGIGLAYSHHVLKGLGGDLTYQPSSKGTTFRVSIRKAK